MSGLAGWARQLQEQNRVRSQFVSDLKLFSQPDFKEPTTFPVVDVMVTKDEAKITANGGALLHNTTVTAAGVEKTEAAWLKYRDAWRSFEAVVNPTISSDDVATQISRERLYHLRKLAE